MSTVTPSAGVKVKVIAGEVAGARGPVGDIVIEPEYLDVELAAGAEFRLTSQPTHTVFAYIIGGHGEFGPEQATTSADNGILVLFAEGESVMAVAGDRGLRFLLVSGKPLGEPVAWRGPIVMNTQAELELAFEEYRQGTFIKTAG